MVVGKKFICLRYEICKMYFCLHLEVGNMVNFMGNNRNKESHLRVIKGHVAKKVKVAKLQRRF
jgi:hypothetical protein